MSNLNKTELVMPNVGANDNEIKIVKIFYEQGSFINNGQVLFELESSKTIFDFISEKNGYFSVGFELAHSRNFCRTIFAWFLMSLSIRWW